MQIDRIFYPIKSLGPGDRLVIWTVGCTKRCYMCSNKELWESNKAKDFEIESMVELINRTLEGRIIDGITITGGDPLEQYDELVELLRLLKNLTDDILIYTGYTIEELIDIIGTKAFCEFTELCSVLIDGKYRDELNDGKCVLRGSTNQIIHFFDESLCEKYDKYINQGRKIQNIFSDNRLISIGIHNRE